MAKNETNRSMTCELSGFSGIATLSAVRPVSAEPRPERPYQDPNGTRDQRQATTKRSAVSGALLDTAAFLITNRLSDRISYNRSHFL